jgi:hypothetical protein
VDGEESADDRRTDRVAIVDIVRAALPDTTDDACAHDDASDCDDVCCKECVRCDDACSADIHSRLDERADIEELCGSNMADATLDLIHRSNDSSGDHEDNAAGDDDGNGADEADDAVGKAVDV